MKNSLSMIGAISLLVFSFIFSKSTLDVAIEMSDLKNIIELEKEKYKVDKIDSKIDNIYIIPGINGKSVNVKKSYYNMKSIGSFVSNLLIYDEVEVNESIKNNKDKIIISGNENKKMVSLLFIVSNDFDFFKIVSILDNYNVEGNFFVDYEFISNNYKKIKIMGNHIIGIKNNNEIIKSDFIIKNSLNQKNNYCYNEFNDLNFLKSCFKESIYSIKPTIVINDNFYKNVKENIKSGSLISFKVNKQLEIELPSIINFIKSKGYNIKNLDIHLNETL